MKYRLTFLHCKYEKLLIQRFDVAVCHFLIIPVWFHYSASACKAEITLSGTEHSVNISVLKVFTKHFNMFDVTETEVKHHSIIFHIEL